MTDEAEKPQLRPSQQLAALLGLPEPEFTEDQERAFQDWMERGETTLRETNARLQERHAA
ncbi:hypothetical protein [Actinoplanes couchii]|uniref:Uncharacterized protein n=1 Tax=Actinoplanes couchii TaxID=403638 RepID=A0ABQ3XM18_9ACTN|nr:hypothetical protein [Actinoplanes couchii]MDR6319268.1 hypothetical protein [Actinoplanes couchii]GID59523.1 hypothetical protein Aco03nite_079270 [Actinoplanes couchii]